MFMQYSNVYIVFLLVFYNSMPIDKFVFLGFNGFIGTMNFILLVIKFYLSSMLPC